MNAGGVSDSSELGPAPNSGAPSRAGSYRHQRKNSAFLSRKNFLGGTLEGKAAVRAALTADESKRADDHLVNQFLRATENNAELVVGHDTSSRPCFYSIFSLGRSKSIEDHRRHMIATFEVAVRSMPPGVEQWMWVSDFHGFGMADCDPRLAKAFLDVSAKHYPERLGQFFVVDAPSVFSLLWKGIRGMVDPNTKEKIVFLPYDYGKKGSSGELSTRLVRSCGPDLAHWLCVEMQQNRLKKVAKHKEYPYGRAFLQPSNLEKSVVLEGHDIRGLPEFQQMVASNPSILLPEGAHA